MVFLVDNVGSLWGEMNEKILLDRQKIESRSFYHATKRLFDFVMSICGLIILSPLMLIIALIIKMKMAALLSINKFELEKMVNNLKCINFVQWL